MKVKGLRLDPGRAWGLYQDDVALAIREIVRNAADANVNTIFTFAYSPVYGAYYNAAAPETWKTGYGEQDFLPRLITAAQAEGIGVVASFRMNWYEGDPGRPATRLLDHHSDWRAKISSGANYKDRFSAHSSGYKTWFTAMLAEASNILDEAVGFEAGEGAIALGMETVPTQMPDYHPEGLQAFHTKYPTEPVGGDKWLDFRASAVTALHKILFDAAHSVAGRKAFTVQDLPTRGASDTRLLSLANYAKGSGFAWQKMVEAGADHLVMECIWQQRDADCPTDGIFTPAWTTSALNQFAALVSGYPEKVLGHVELSEFQGSATGKVVKPTAAQFTDSLTRAVQAPAGTSVYDYNFVVTEGHIGTLATAYA